MKRTKKMIAWVYVIAAGWFLAVAHARGDTFHYAAQQTVQNSKYHSPEDMLDMIPFLGEIPRNFLFGDGYTMKLSGTQLRIDHMGLNSRSGGEQRTCMVGLSYITPVAFFSTRVDIPIFHSPTMALKDWSRDAVGDYVIYMSKTPVNHPALTLSITARF